MKYNFYDKNIVVGYIKELLHNFNLPVCKIYTKDTKLFEGRTYIKDNNFYKCFKLDTGGLYLDRKTPYVYNKKFINVTTNFNITSSEYDTKTHEYLGNYLRFIRDYYNIDLMPLYNCYSNRVLDSLYKEYSLEDSGDSVFINTGKYNYYLIPVKFNKDYTIALDSCKSYNIFCAIYKNGIDNVNNNQQIVKIMYFFIFKTENNTASIIKEIAPNSSTAEILFDVDKLNNKIKTITNKIKGIKNKKNSVSTNEKPRFNIKC